MSRLTIPVGPDDHTQGSEDAEITLLEYGDYECPHCGAAHPIIKRVQSHFRDRLRFAYRNFPLTQIHPHAEPAAETAEFAGSEGKFWPMHDLLFENQDQLGTPLFEQLAEDLDLSTSRLNEVLLNHEFQSRVLADLTSGVRSGVNGTPTFFINGIRHDGPFDFATMVMAIEEALLTV
jgi:protein-disulfide isomerase